MKHLNPHPRNRLNKLTMRMLKMKLVLGLTGLLSFSANQLYSQVTVTATAGTASSNYTTVNAAFTAINAGTHQGAIIVTVTANTTEPTTPVPLLRSNAPSSYTSVLIQPSGNVTINSAASPSANRGILEFAGADNITIDGDDPLTTGSRNLSIVAATSSTAGIACIRLSSNSTTGADGGDNNTVKNCIITGSRNSATSTTVNYGIQFANGTGTSSSSTGAYSSLNTLIQNNQITRCYYGIYCYGNSTTYYNTGTVIRGNTIGSSTSANIVGYYGIFLNYSSAGTTGNAIIEENDIQVGDITTGYSVNIAGIYINTGANGTIIRKNKIHDVANPSSSGYGAYGIQLAAAVSATEISNNFISDITATNYSTSMTTDYQNYGIYISAAATGVKILHNTLVLNKPNATNYGTSNPSSALISITSSNATVAQMLNNILVNAQGVASSNAYCIITSATGNISGGTINNNDYYVNGNGKIGYYSAAARNTLPLWQTATSKDALSKNELPPFTSTTDFHFASGTYTTLESAGANIATTGIIVDIDNQTRPGPSTYGFGAAPDIGADEFDGRQGLCGPVAATTTNATPSTNLCAGNTVNFSLTPVPSGAGYTYQWQRSNDNVTYTNITNATAITYSGAVTEKYYRCLIKCASTSDSSFSSPITLNYNSDLLTTTPGQRCGTGMVNLAATATAGATIGWYQNSFGGAALGTGPSFTTPPINATTTFYAQSQMIIAGSAIIGAGATTNADYPNPFYSNWSNTHNQYLITAAELQNAGLAAGNITSMGIRITAGTTNLQEFSVKMAHTNATSMTAFLAPAFTNVFNTATLTPIVGMNTITFATPFNWDGISNVVIEICQGNSNSTATVSSTAVADNTPYVSTIHVHKTNATAGNTACTDLVSNLATYSVRPQFTFNGQTICASVRRQPVVATVNSAPTFDVTNNKTVCNNGVTALTVLSPATNFNQVTWNPVTNLYTNAAGTTPYVAGTNAQTVYQRSGTAGLVTYVATANNTSTLCGATDTVSIQTLPATTTAIATLGSLCFSGSTSLSLTPAITQTGFTYQWQSSMDNITFVDTNGTGATYTTPTLTATRYYRAVIKNSNGVACFNSVSDTVFVSKPQVVSSTGAEKCGPGSLNLAATTNPGYTLNWYANAGGGTVLGTGPNFTTPNLTSTTTYYVGAGSGTNGVATLGAGAQTSVSGNPDYTGVSPYAYHYGNYKHQMLITAAEMNALGITAGTITSLAFDVVTAGNPVANFNNFNITLIPTTQTAMAATFVGGGTNVFSATSVTPSVGMNTYLFTTPFSWDGVSNIIVQTCYNNNNSGVVGSSAEVRYDNTPFVSHSIYRVDGTNNTVCAATTGNASNDGPIVSKRPKMVFGYNSRCESPRTPVTATILQKPVASLNPTGTVNICAGDSTTLTASGGSTYSWLRNGTTITGQTNATLHVSQADSYRAVVKAVNGCTDTSVIANVVVQPNPVVFLGNDTTYCGNTPYTLDAGNAGATFLWNDNSTAGTLNVVNAGQYSVKVTNNMYNCSSRDTINIIHNPYPIVHLGNDTLICSVMPLTLDASNTGASYLWNTNANTQTISVSQAGDYSVTVTNGFNCIGKDSIAITVRPPTDNFGFDFEPLFNIQPGRVKFTPLHINPEYTYLWDFGDGTTSTLTMPTHDYASSGNYNVTLRSSDGCTDSLEQLDIYVDIYTNVVKVNKSDLAVKVYPNPSSNVLNIQLESNDASIQSLTVFNVLGQQVFHMLPQSKQSKQEQISLDNLASGGYIIKINTDKGTINRKFDLIK